MSSWKLPCSDYFGSGICTRGNSCPLSHGEDPVVVSDFKSSKGPVWRDAGSESSQMQGPGAPLRTHALQGQTTESSLAVSNVQLPSSQPLHSPPASLISQGPEAQTGASYPQWLKSPENAEARSTSGRASVLLSVAHQDSRSGRMGLSNIEECIRLASESLRAGMFDALHNSAINGQGAAVSSDETSSAVADNLDMPAPRTSGEWNKEALERRREFTEKKGQVYSNLLQKKRRISSDGTMDSTRNSENDDADDEVILVSESREVEFVRKRKAWNRTREPVSSILSKRANIPLTNQHGKRAAGRKLNRYQQVLQGKSKSRGVVDKSKDGKQELSWSQEPPVPRRNLDKTQASSCTELANCRKSGSDAGDSQKGLKPSALEGVRRNSYRLTDAGVPRPVITFDPKPKVPLKARQFFADKLCEAWMRAGLSDMDACARTIALEESIYFTSPTKIEYRSGCARAIKEARAAYKKKIERKDALGAKA